MPEIVSDFPLVHYIGLGELNTLWFLLSGRKSLGFSKSIKEN